MKSLSTLFEEAKILKTTIGKALLALAIAGIALSCMLYFYPIREQLYNYIQDNILHRSINHPAKWLSMIYIMAVLGTSMFSVVLIALISDLFIHTKAHTAIADTFRSFEETPPVEMLRAWGKNQKKCNLFAFLGVFCIGLLAHGFMFFNKFSYEDDIGLLFGYGGGVQLGRWGLELLGSAWAMILGNYSMPLLNGFISLVFIAATACVILKLLGITDSFASFTTGALLSTFPSVTGTFGYMFTAAYFFLSVLLMVQGVRYLHMEKRNYAIAVACMVLSISIYQAYVGIGLALALLLVIKDCVDEGKTPKAVLLDALRLLIGISLSVALYAAITKVIWKTGIESASSYQNIASFTSFSMKDVLTRIVNAYSSFLSLAYKNYIGVNPGLIVKLIFIASAFLTLYISIVRSRRNSLGKNAILWICILLIPLAVNIVHLYGAQNIHGLMVYPIVFIILLPIFLLEFACIERKTKIMDWCAYAISIAAIVCFVFYANEAYLKIHFIEKETTQYFSTLVTRIKGSEGYSDEAPVVYLGAEHIEDRTITTMPEFKNVEITGFAYDAIDLINDYNWEVYQRIQCGYSPVKATDEERNRILSNPEVGRMPSYPDDGSIKLIDGILVVKLSKSQ